MRVRRLLDQISEKLSIFILGLMVILVVWQVVSRYVFKEPVPWSEQLAKYLFVWLVLINGAYMFGKKGHMNISFFRGKMPQKVQHILSYVLEIIVLLFAAGILLVGGYMALKVGIPQRDSALTISMGYVYAALPISGILTSFYSICNLADLAKGSSKKEKGV